MLESYRPYAIHIESCTTAQRDAILMRWDKLMSSWGWPLDVIECMVHLPDDCIHDGGFIEAFMQAVQFVALVSATYCNMNEAWMDEHENILDYVFLGVEHFDLSV